MSGRFDEDDVAEVMRHLDRLEERYRELGDLEATLREAIRAVRRTRGELKETLKRLDRLDQERTEESAPGSDREGPSVRKASPSEPKLEVVPGGRARGNGG